MGEEKIALSKHQHLVEESETRLYWKVLFLIRKNHAAVKTKLLNPSPLLCI